MARRARWQVNLTVVLPGQTVGNTVASSEEELAKFASGFSFDGKRLTLRSQGSFETLGWAVSTDVPVETVASLKK